MNCEVVTKLIEALPVGAENALTGAEVAERAGLNRRSGGTRLNALRDKRVQCTYDNNKRQYPWWRTA